MFDYDAVTAAGEGRWPAATPQGSRMPEVIDGYRIDRVLGEGGMGTVYLAEQNRPQRPVALKVIRPGCATPAMLRRFELETEVLGRLQHSGIAQIHDAGTIDLGHGAQPYFAMEYIEGVPLDCFVREKSLSPRETLALMAEIARAVQHAHQRGVIHRDLKPANILVTESGQPKILDFGVARSIDADIMQVTLQTDIGQLVGTVPYMSPEQIAGDAGALDTRSDVYSLGVIAYELLTGKLPHDLTGRTIADAARLIQDAAIPNIARQDRALRGDVETIIHTALERDRERRYASASDFASDIAAWLAHEPISARPPSAVYQMRKFAQRHRAPVAAGIAVFVVAIAASIISTIGFAQATVMRKQAEVDRGLAEEARAEATAVSGFLIGDLLSTADPAVSQDSDLTVREAVDVAAARVDRAFPDQPGVRRSLHETMGSVYVALAEYDNAVREFGAARALTDTSTPDGLEQDLMIRRGLAMIQRDRGELELSRDAMQSVADEAAEAFGGHSLAAVMARADLGSVLIAAGHYVEAESMLTDVAERLGGELGEHDRRTMTARHNLIMSISNQGRLAEARAKIEALLTVRREHFGATHPDTLSTMNNLATTLSELGDYEASEPLLREVIATRTELLGPDHPVTLTARANLCHLLLTLKRLDEAEPLIRANLVAQEEIFGRTHQSTLITLNHLAYLLEDLGRVDEAREAFVDALNRWLDFAGESNPNTMIAMNNLAMLLQKQGETGAALEQFSKLVAAATAHLPEGHFYWGIFRDNHGACLAEAGRYDEAIAALEESQAVLVVALGENHDRVKKSAQRLKEARTAQEMASR